MMFCEREDEGHVFKVNMIYVYKFYIIILMWCCLNISVSLRQGGPRELSLERFDEAAHEESSGLTHTALSGERKQSVEDVERLFSQEMVEWMQKKGYTAEAACVLLMREGSQVNNAVILAGISSLTTLCHGIRMKI